MTPVLAFERVSKSFGELRALADVSVELRGGEIHALPGENGAGKTTLVRMALGLIAPDHGRLLVDGRAAAIGNPSDAAKLGIGMVHQHFTLADGLTVAENLALGDAPAFFTRRRLVDEARERMRRHGLEVEPARRVGSLAVGEKQRVEIVKALERGARVLLLDEPTAVLTPGESEQLFQKLEQLRARGRALLLITHKLDEALRVAQRVTVLRGGRVALTATRAEVTAETLARTLFAEPRTVSAPNQVPPVESAAGAPILRARALRGERFGPLDLELRAGDCVAIAGVDGNGQTELIETLVGLRKPLDGSLERPRRDVAFVSGDRHATGLALDLSLAENLALKPSFLPRAFHSPRVLAAAAAPLLARFDVKTSGPRELARRLSGGNQQKVVLARELSGRPRLVLAENPTRGLDLRATAFVHEQLRNAKRAGAAVLIASTDLDEALALSDRLFVMQRGRLHPCALTSTAVAELMARLATSPFDGGP